VLVVAELLALAGPPPLEELSDAEPVALGVAEPPHPVPASATTKADTTARGVPRRLRAGLTTVGQHTRPR
jgi:hypothetical protein